MAEEKKTTRTEQKQKWQEDRLKRIPVSILKEDYDELANKVEEWAKSRGIKTNFRNRGLAPFIVEAINEKLIKESITTEDGEFLQVSSKIKDEDRQRAKKKDE